MAKHKQRDFEDVVRQIARSEEDVDKVLKAAKLQRWPRASFWDRVGFSEAVFGGLLLLFALGMVLMMVLTILFD